MVKKRCTAILLAAGSGSRMKSDIPKQYMELCGRPLIWYALHTIQESGIIDDCVVVTSKADIPYMRDEIVRKYGFSKVDVIVEGGAERFLSVANAIKVIRDKKMSVPNEDGYIFIHDGARPFLTEQILRDTYEAVCEHHACVAAVPSKDTIKIADEQGYVAGTPERRLVWSIQTPQVFDTRVILDAYERLMNRLPQMEANGIVVTDDAGVVELFTNQRVKLVEASYENIKITTPEDIKTAEAFLGKSL